MVAPVVGETNLFMHSCCIIRPATLMPMPVHKIARRRGRREAKNISSCSALPLNRLAGLMSMTPTNRETTDKTARAAARMTVKARPLIKIPPSSMC